MNLRISIFPALTIISSLIGAIGCFSSSLFSKNKKEEDLISGMQVVSRIDPENNLFPPPPLSFEQERQDDSEISISEVVESKSLLKE